MVLTLETPFEPFMLMFDASACAIVPKHIYDSTDYRTNPANQQPIGTGPFQFVEWQRGNFVRMKRFDDYWMPGQPYLDEIIYRIIPDSQSRALALETGPGAADRRPTTSSRSMCRASRAGLPRGDGEGVGLITPLMSAWGSTTASSRSTMCGCGGRSAWRLTASSCCAACGSASASSRDRDHLPPPPNSTTRRWPSCRGKNDPKAADATARCRRVEADAKGVRFTIKHLALPYGEVWMRLSEYFRTALRQVGIEVVLETTDAGGWARRIGDWDYETSVNFLSQYGDPTLGVERSYVSTNIKKVTFTNTGGYSNLKVDELFTTAREAGDPAVRQKAFTEVQKILCEELPQIWLMELAWPTIHERQEAAQRDPDGDGTQFLVRQRLPRMTCS